MRLFRNAMAIAIVLAAATVPAPRARAASVVSNAAGVCQGSLPIYNDKLRKRALGILDEGETSASLNCGSPWGTMPGTTPQANVAANNRNDTPTGVEINIVGFGYHFGSTS